MARQQQATSSQMTGFGYWHHAMFLIMSAPARIDVSLANTLRNLRLDRGDTQEDLAHNARLTVAALARIERGQANPTWTTVTRIAAALDLDLVQLGEAVEATRD
jgi:DNA-binding XRE family transcriptional regulator